MISVSKEIISVLYICLSIAFLPKPVCVPRGPWGGNMVTLIDGY